MSFPNIFKYFTWSDSKNYPPNSVIRGGGGLYCSKVESGPDTSAGIQNPDNDTTNTYWNPMPNDDNNVVHRTGDETVSGEKLFIGLSDASTDVYSGIKFIHNAFEKGTTQTTDYWWALICEDNQHKPYSGNQSHSRVGEFDVRVKSNGDVGAILGAHCNNPEHPNSTSQFQVVCEYGGLAYACAPSTPQYEADGTTLRGYPLDVLTRDWIPKDTRIVHTTGNEEISGLKKFTETYVLVKNAGMQVNATPTTNLYQTYGFYDKNDIMLGRLLLYHNGNGNRGLSLSLAKKASSSDLLVMLGQDLDPSTNKYTVNVGGSGCTAFQARAAGITLGGNSTTYRWGQIYSSSTTIQTSDERVKRQITPVPDNVLDAWADVNWVQFKMADSLEEKGDSARLHNGMIAQQVDSVFKKYDLDVSKYGLFCYDEWEKEEPTLDENGNEIYRGQEAGNLYSLRYEEALCMEAAYQRRRASRAEARITELEQRLNSLEEKLVGKD